jgi:hypothetical protein
MRSPSDKLDLSVTFTGGFVVKKDWIVISTRVSYLDDDVEHTRVFTLKEGKWLQFDLDSTVVSLCAVDHPVPSLYCLSRDGGISIRRKGGPVEERISSAGSGAGQLGYLHQIRLIGSTLYVCGVANQIYRRAKSGWVHFDEGVLDRRGPLEADTLFSIDGNSEDSIYTVGTGGQVWHHDGKLWHRIQAPTPKNLNWVRSLSEEDTYVCGEEGRFFRHTGNGWTDFSAQAKITGDLWCVEVFQKKVYVAADSGLFVFDGKKLAAVKTGFDVGEGHRLHANDGVLWYFGINDLCFFDGKKWTYVKHPDNP